MLPDPYSEHVRIFRRTAPAESTVPIPSCGRSPPSCRSCASCAPFSSISTAARLLGAAPPKARCSSGRSRSCARLLGSPPDARRDRPRPHTRSRADARALYPSGLPTVSKLRKCSSSATAPGRHPRADGRARLVRSARQVLQQPARAAPRGDHGQSALHKAVARSSDTSPTTTSGPPSTSDASSPPLRERFRTRSASGRPRPRRIHHWRVDLGFLSTVSCSCTENRVPTAAPAPLELYRRLPAGWRPGPEEMPSDLHMWHQILSVPGCRAVSGTRPTVLHFPSGERKGWSSAERLRRARRLGGSHPRPRVAQRVRAAGAGRGRGRRCPARRGSRGTGTPAGRAT